MNKRASPAEELERFLNIIDECMPEYRYAYDAVNEEDRCFQDLLHAMEFAGDKTERNRMATKLSARFSIIDGMTNVKVARAMNRMFPKREIPFTDENVNKRIQRFFENVPQCPDELY